MPPNANISEDENELLHPELQLLGGEHTREKDVNVLKELLEVLYLLVVKDKGGEKEGGKRAVKESGGYLVVRELHLVEEDEGVRGACEKVVDVLLVGEAEAEREKGELVDKERVKEVDAEEDDGDEKIVEVF